MSTVGPFLGFRFAPNDGELLHYLDKKVKNEPTFDGIKEVKVYDHRPEILAEKYPPLGEKGWFFFTPRDRKHQNGKRPNRKVGDGFWKSTGGNKEVNYNNEIVGFKQVLVFYEEKGKKTNWIMHEYKINNLHDAKFDDMVVCRIYEREVKQKPSRNHQEEAVDNRVDRIEYASETNPVVDNMVCNLVPEIPADIANGSFTRLLIEPDITNTDQVNAPLETLEDRLRNTSQVLGVDDLNDNMDVEGMMCNEVPEIPADFANGSFPRLLMEPDVTNTDQVNTPLETLEDRSSNIWQVLGVDDLNDNMETKGMICNYVPEIPADFANGSFTRSLMEPDITNTNQVNTPVIETLEDRLNNIRQPWIVDNLNDYSSFPDVDVTNTDRVNTPLETLEDRSSIIWQVLGVDDLNDNMDVEGMMCNYVPEIPADFANGSFTRSLMEPDITNTDQINTPVLETLEDRLNNIRQPWGVDDLNDYSSFPDVKDTSTGNIGEVAMMNRFEHNHIPDVAYLSNGSEFHQVPADFSEDVVPADLPKHVVPQVSDGLLNPPLSPEVSDDLFYFINDDDALFAQDVCDLEDLDF